MGLLSYAVPVFLRLVTLYLVLSLQDVIDFRPKYRPMLFELRVFPHDHYADDDSIYATPQLLIAQDTRVVEVIELLCHSA